ncbi:hypothetical protein [Halospeciosus flavus]|uniref:Hydroxymethylglutaryl-CoA synthase n=1 Tax=Halospeciosus flavus TaxID=3032283 RepID=A0ABD5Z0J3_9EURY|nr:hypothetical protein [Halospeciosus flavus]
MSERDLTPVESAGAYVPRYTISAETIGEAWDGFRARGVSEKRVPAGDEDAVTMAVEAARDAIAASDVAREELSALALGTTTPPIDEGDVGVQVAEMLGLPRSVEVSVFTQSTRAGTRALLAASRADGPALAVASDCPLGEPDDALDHAAGAGAVAFLTAESGTVDLTDVATYAQEYPGTRFRRRGSESIEEYGATTYGRDAYATAVAGAVDGLDLGGDADVEPTGVALSAPDGSLPGRGARRLPFDAEIYHLAGELGDTGAASALFGLLAAWEDGSENTVVVGYGDGAGADALVTTGTLDTDWRRTGHEITYAEYLRKRGHVLPDGGER